ncbi:putative baseplate assembly protein [Microbacterium sp. B2969]|uniref:Baseplate assembly protein n=1 Tax=Microbacterium alkaliflavum TaxID=3248839 RepID=A0ABW7Q9X1_9MICO
MALIGPILDNRTQPQLHDELVRRIPAYSPTWTNHNESDPGIVLLELFAHLGESLLYRFNQIPETTRVEFLRLLGVQPRPALPARVLLSAVTDVPGGVQVLKGSQAAAGKVSFQTVDEVYVWPLEAVAAGKTATTGGAADSRADALSRAKLKSGETPAFYRTVLTSADPSAPDAQTIDVSEQIDGALWVALLSTATTDAAALAGQTIFLGVAFDEKLDPPPLLEKLAPGAAEEFRAGILTGDPPPTLWELWQGPGAARPLVRLAVLGDTTLGMVTTGIVKLEIPALPGLTGLGGGGEDSPPPLDDEELSSRVIAWLRVSRPAGNDIGDAIHRVRWIGANCVDAEQSITPPPEFIGTGTGDFDQRFPLTHSPVLRGTVQLQVEEPDGWTDWVEVESFARSGLDDRHFTVDLESGAVVFGRARVPQLGERVRVPSYRYSDGKDGNVPAGTVASFPQHPAVTVANPFPARGGADAAPLADALAAIPAEVHRRDRAVTPDDYRDLVEELPEVARAEVLPTFHPDTPTVKAAGVTSVVVFPKEDIRNPAAPMPDIGLLRQVARHLEPRRLVTAELYVIPPEYVPVAISIGVQVRAGYQVDAVRRWVETIVEQYLSAIPPSGPDGRGWPLGRPVRAAELEAVAVQVEGVEYAIDTRLALVTAATPTSPQVVTEQETVPMQAWQLPEVVAVEVVRGDPPAPGTSAGPVPSGKVPVPLPPEVC